MNVNFLSKIIFEISRTPLLKTKTKKKLKNFLFLNNYLVYIKKKTVTVKVNSLKKNKKSNRKLDVFFEKYGAY